MDIYIFGTCRVCYPVHDQITFAKQLREYHSRYYTIGTDIHIYTEPVNYTTKLVDVLDSILYMKGKLYATLDPKKKIRCYKVYFSEVIERYRGCDPPQNTSQWKGHYHIR